MTTPPPSRSPNAIAVRVTIESAPARDRPYGWIVTVASAARVRVAPAMTYVEACDLVTAELLHLVRTGSYVVLSPAEAAAGL